MRGFIPRAITFTFALALLFLFYPFTVAAQMRSNAACVDPGGEAVFYNPADGEDIIVPLGYKVEALIKNLNFPTAIAFVGNKDKFQIIVLESGTGLPGACNDPTRTGPVFGRFSATNPFHPGIRIFNKNGGEITTTRLGTPTAQGRGFQPDGPAIGLAFEHEFQGGTLFGTDSNQGVRGAPGSGNNTSRIVTIDLRSGTVTPFITGLPTGDHPTEQILVKDGFVFWSQGSATNSGVTGHDNGGGGNQHEIACQPITLSNNLFDSGDGHLSSGYSRHNQRRPGEVVQPFEDATRTGMCTGAILRAKIHSKDPGGTVEPVSWGYRNPFGIRFAPDDHPLEGCIFVTENGEDERGARPTNNAPDRLHCARQNPDGSPDYHGWPDRFGFLDSKQAIFNPQGGPADDLCPGFPVCNAALFAPPQTPVGHVLASPPQPPVAPLAIEPTDVAAVGPDFAPKSFAHGVVRRGAAFVAREGDFGFSPRNGTPIVGHDIELVNFSRKGEPLQLELSRFAFNCRQQFQSHSADGSPICNSDADADTAQAFAHNLRGINRPLTVMFGPDDALYLVDYGAVRDFGRSDSAKAFVNAADAPLAQIPGTGTIWKISRTR
jgi:glucose/arabinose dehydrogenase